MHRHAVILAIALAAACVGTGRISSPGRPPTCAARETTSVKWIRTAPPREAAALDRECAAISSPVRMESRHAGKFSIGPIAIVSWNTHSGAGDIGRFVADLRSSRLTGGTPVAGFVLLLQEVSRAAAAAGPPADTSGIYVPSMRNGPPSSTGPDDRGNAMYSTLPLSDITAIVLPLERQRRVALEATVELRAPGGAVTPLRLVDTHFTNTVAHHLWLASEFGRDRQARALAGVLPRDGSLVVGGDFNAWFGFRDAAYREIAHAGLRGAAGEDRRPTFGHLRLDHLLFRLPGGWRVTVRRADDRYGSDHYPLIALVEPPW
jgi:endonuclease/exonuclease/phosphatase family metal-dependent hydrolase